MVSPAANALRDISGAANGINIMLASALWQNYGAINQT